MPKEGISIYFTIQDGASTVLKTIGDKTKALDKETQELAQACSALEAANKPLISRQSELKNALEKSADAVKDAKKAFHELGDEASELKMNEAIAEQDALKRELKDVESQITSNQKAFNSYREDIRKGALEADSIAGGAFAGGSETSILSTLGQAGLWSALGDKASEIGSAFVASAYGDEGSTMFSSILGTAGTGAAIGTAIAPGIGTAIGGILGGVAGVLSGESQIAQEKDQAFIEYYNGLYEDVSGNASEMVESGSSIAGGREQTQRAFAQRLGGDEEADAYLERVKTMAAGTNYAYDEITGYSKLLLNTYDPDEVFGVLQSLSDATAGLNLSSSDVSVMISGLSRMRTTGKTTQEYLNYFSERGVDVYTALGNALGVDKSQIAGMVSKGEISGETSAQAILDYIDATYGGLSEDLMSTYDAMTDNLEDILSNLEAEGGEGYNEERKKGIEAQSDAFEGPLGDAIGEINSIIGQNQAYMENLSEQYQRDALSAVLLGKKSNLFSEEEQTTLDDMHQQYEEWSAKYDAADQEGDEAARQEAAQNMQSLYEQAQELATAYYESCDTYQTMQEVEMDQIEAIRENTAGLAAATNAYRLGQEQSKGEAATKHYGAIFENGELTDDAAYFSDQAQRDLDMWGGGFAMGLDRVPFDNFPALLHEGERVLTAQEARAQDAEAMGGIFDSQSAFSTAGRPFDTKPGSFAMGLDRAPYDDFLALLHEDERVLPAQEARAQDAGADSHTIQITITGNHFTGSTEEMADQLAEIIVRKLEQEVVAAAPK